MTTLTKDAPPTAAQSRQWQDGKQYRCVKSMSPGYKFGRVYTCYKRRGQFYMLGSDGYEDNCSMLVSGFEEYGDGLKVV